MAERAGQENNFQTSLISALTMYRYTRGDGRIFTNRSIDTPSPRQQGTDLTKGTGKPFDVAFQLRPEDKVIMLEVKDRHDNNEFNSDTVTDGPQHQALKDLWKQGVFIWYTYNFCSMNDLPDQAGLFLQQTHVLPPSAFSAPLAPQYAPPDGKAQTLLDLLEKQVDDPLGERLGELIQRDPHMFASMSVNALLFIANLDDATFIVLPLASLLKTAHKYRALPEARRDKMKIQLQNDPWQLALAQFMFDLADATPAVTPPVLPPDATPPSPPASSTSQQSAKLNKSRSTKLG